MKMLRNTAKYKIFNYRRNQDIFKELVVQINNGDNECIKQITDGQVMSHARCYEMSNGRIMRVGRLLERLLVVILRPVDVTRS